MKKFLILLLIATIIFNHYCFAQNVALQWMKSIGTLGAESIQIMQTDANSNLYISIILNDSADIDPGPRQYKSRRGRLHYKI